VTAALAAAYLTEDDPRWQSGFDGDADLWREARELILDGVDRDGTFLDIGCATGYLLECLATWASQRELHLSMYGLELNGELADAARRRLPNWAHCIFQGNAIDWQPPMRFTYVRTGLEYVPPKRSSSLVARLVQDVVEPGGRLIVGPVSYPELEEATLACVAAGFPKPEVRAATDRKAKTRYILWVARSSAA
jgi:trans-aconitate methyltransferase